MKLPPVHMPVAEWAPVVRERWTVLVEKGARMKAASGKSDAFDAMLARLRDMASTGRFDGLPELLKRRLTARALTWLWLNDETMGRRLLSSRLLSVLVDAQQPRLTRITLQQLAQFYFRRFDKLDEHDGLRKQLEQILLQQLHLLPEPKVSGPQADPLVTLKRDGHWLLPPDGPVQLVERVRDSGHELGQTFEVMGLQGFDDGRYGDICRAHFYLETLRGLSPGEYDPVLDELQKPAVSKAPYEGERRIGHVALEILIDRAGQEPGEVWQNFILNLAGDPRIASTAANYREWWQPLGEARIQKVRGWLSKEDLRLFLQAVEQYGLESGKEDLKRMFPARKLFLEGLFALGLIRHTRLMLGRNAKQSVKRILGSEVKTSFAGMDSAMSDKAVIYLDCGDFHLVEGSHSFKIWVYLGQPGHWVKSYERNQFSHLDLTTSLPSQYKAAYPSLPYEAVTHNGSWQRKVFDFLADNGIALDIEKLLSRSEYKAYLSKYGLPAVSGKKARVEPLVQQSAKSDSAPVSQIGATGFVAAHRMAEPRPPAVDVFASEAPRASGTELTDTQLSILAYLSKHPESLMGDIRRALEGDEALFYEIQDALRGSISSYVQQNEVFQWSLSSKGEALLRRADLDPAPNTSDADQQPLMATLQRLGTFDLQVLWYFKNNPGDKVRHAANVFGVEARVINQVLYGSLKGMCVQDKQFGWSVNETTRLSLEALDKQDRAE
ncbi:EH signature domain-containing protein [Pseudomonas aeruginosa]|nr:EH signature domain-containing protein [Pseudomonas aeruginosa]EKS2405607.1 hypothetical protein [Pseudomonas aeruginosa]EKW2497799.1 hypothetical protein [Pseudomonas aeruginosa]EKW4464467.1 hypothetical protein [Pseudomonas aeruginosa]EKX1099511.1 hypothetical protein [Pseudomonas aeruginosa]EKX4038412.1 hypothetical protein [Pseudomonas aeruginosa]